MALPLLETTRLHCRMWHDEDQSMLARIYADPLAMRYYPKTLNEQESLALFEHFMKHIRIHGFGPWVVEQKENPGMMGFACLLVPSFESHFTPCVEIGWVFHPLFWGKGFATEAATAILNYGFDVLSLPEIVAYTATQNKPSMAVMERLGMTCNPEDDFDHPKIADGHPLKRHVLYRLTSNLGKKLQGK